MIYAEILAGGKGTRMGNTDMPKQFLNLGNKPILIHTIENFLLVSRIDKIIVVTPRKWIQHTRDIISKFIPSNFISKIDICEGGADRNESIMCGINFIDNLYSISPNDIIITHDAVRPFVTSRIINENIDMTLKYGAVDTVIPAVDTIVESIDNNIITSIPQRKFMYQGQTPQSFNIQDFISIYNQLSLDEKNTLTDAAKIFVLKNKDVKLVNGEIFNIKITTTYDLKIANLLVGGLSYDK